MPGGLGRKGGALMERTTAIKRLKKLLGPKAYWRIGEFVTSPDRRRRHELRRLEADFQAATTRLDMSLRLAALVAADDVYQRLKDRLAAVQLEQKVIFASADEGGYRFEVGTTSPLPGIGNVIHQRACGDTWEEVFAKLAVKS